MQFLIQFTYEGWCQGPEDMTETRLVHADTYEEAVKKIKAEFDNAHDFYDFTVI